MVGDKEVEAGTVSLRRRGEGNLGARALAELRDELVAEAALAPPRPPHVNRTGQARFIHGRGVNNRCQAPVIQVRRVRSKRARSPR